MDLYEGYVYFGHAITHYCASGCLFVHFPKDTFGLYCILQTQFDIIINLLRSEIKSLLFNEVIGMCSS